MNYIKKNFLKNYIENIQKLLYLDSIVFDRLINAEKELLNLKKKNNKVIIFGNGGSLSIADHLTVDLIKNANIKALCPSSSPFITALSNDLGFDNWITNAIKLYASAGDIIIFISSSGSSKNIINAAKYCIKNKLKIITLTGFSNNNFLNKNGNINFHVDSKSYNIIESIHQIYLVALVDLIIGKKEYKVNKFL